MNKLVGLAVVALLQVTSTSARTEAHKFDPEDKCPTLCERDYDPVYESNRVLRNQHLLERWMTIPDSWTLVLG
ncbi:putative secreted RxLR effector protein [Phytophthora cinnamomi]|uniref:putative secreted RxLR effector protein n=1 Tax=Phytophthora cinnamomi TaxID=4785 RepID=UPI003559EC07|nr:putative secreted RxLR effector protein [Phytophthora cinnamomi]